MSKKVTNSECLWYNGEFGYYELLDFDPNGLTKEQVARDAWKLLKKKYPFDEEEKSKVLETLYLLNVDALDHVTK